MGFISGEKDYFDESAFKPSWSEQDTQRRVQAYYVAPHTFPQAQLDVLHSHANHYGIQIDENRVTAHDDEIKFKRLLQKLGSGFLSGFTTFEVGDEPRNDAEAIANSLGHLAGFVGFIPTAPLKALNATKMVSAAQALRGKSVPMLAASQLQKAVTPVSKKILDNAMNMRSKAVADAANFLNKDVPSHMIEGAFHLGTASAVGAWQQGIDGMIQAGVHGGVMGGAFRGIANMINKGGARTLVRTVEKDHLGRPKPAKQVLTLDQKQDRALRGLAGSLFDGLPSTLRGDTTAQQVYHYLLGAYFGAQETTAVEMGRNKFLQKMEKSNSETIRNAQKVGMEKGYKGERLQKFIMKETSNDLNYVPELTKGWGKLSERVQESVKEEAANLWGYKSDSRTAGYKMLEDILGEDDAKSFIDDLEMPVEEGFTDTGKLKHGARLVIPMKDQEHKYVMGSGGAIGSDAKWAEIGLRYGVDNVVHYSFKGHKTAPKLKGDVYKLNDKALAEGNIAVEKASKRLGKTTGRKKYTLDLLRRNYHQVVHSDGVFAIGSIVRKGKRGKKDPPINEVRGGTGWAIAMAKDMQGREIHVWDTVDKGWHKWNRSKRIWEKEKAPKLTPDFAGIGSRGVLKGKNYIMPKGAEEAIEDVYKATFGEPIEKSKAEKAKIKAEKEKIVSAVGGEKNDAEKHKIIKEENLGEPSLQDILASGSVEGPDVKPLKKSKKGEDVSVKGQLDDSKQTSATPVSNRTVSYVKRELAGIHLDDTAKIHKMAKKLDKILDKASSSKLKDGLSYKIEDSMDIVKKGMDREWGITLKDSKLLEMKQQLFLRNAGVQVPHFTVTNGKISDKPIASKNLAQNDKRQRAPEMWISHVWQSHGKSGHGYAILDHFVEGQNGRFREYSFGQQKERLKDKTKSDDAWNKTLADIYEKMFTNHNMYAYGGRGDAERMYFVKVHPKVPVRKIHVDKMLEEIPEFKLDNMPTWVKKYATKSLLTAQGKTLKPKMEMRYKKMIISNALYEAEMNGFTPDVAGIKKLLAMKDRVGMKKGVIDWNKRQQIWFTNGYSADRAFFLKNKKRFKLGELKDSQFKYMLFEDASEKGLNAKSLARKYTEATDGAILAEEGFVDALNESFGMPESGQNKSFIVSPHSEHGALLGKFMFHKVTPEASKWMRKQGIHMLIPRSAAKQSGNRDYFDLFSASKAYKEPRFTIGGKKANPQETDMIYGMDIAHIKGSLSEKDTEHQLQNQRLPKQMLTNLTAYNFATKGDPKLEAKYQKSLDRMFEEIIGENFRGSKPFNSKLQDLMDNYGDLKPKERAKKVEFLLNNIDKIGVDQLLKAIKTPYAQEFTTKAYRKIVKKTDEIIMDKINDGELTQKEGAEYYQESASFKTLMDRLLALEGQMGGDTTPIWFHKFVRDFRMQAMRNFVVYQVTRPSMPNSISGRMRPYDPWLRADKNMKRLDKDDSIFFLDDMYRHMKIQVPKDVFVGEKAPRTLGKLWDKYQEMKDNKQLVGKKFEDFLHAVVVRVPMDSLSGAHDLKFAGFTGINGKGILLHPRTMQALGGADLDGDKAFAFFGMPKSYRDMYGKNKYEFSSTGDAKGIIKDNKEDFRDILTRNNPEEMKVFQEQSAVWDPMLREDISMRAADGRARLGPAVINRQAAIAMHASLSGSKQSETVPFTMTINKKKHTFDIEISPKTDAKELAYARELMRASIAFPSDPLDEAGLKSKSHFQWKVFESLFNVKIPKDMEKALGKKKMKDFLEGTDKKDPGIYKLASKSLMGTLKRMNSAYYGRNWDTGRRWYFPEIQEMAEPIYTDFSPEMINTMMPKMVQELGKIDWSDNVFARIDKKGLEGLYGQWDIQRKDIDWLKKQLGRTSFKVKYNPVVKNTIDRQLYLPEKRNAAVESIAAFRRAVANTHFPMRKGFEKDLKEESYRRDVIEELYTLSQDAIVRDMTDITTFEMLRDYIKASKIPRRNVVHLSKFAQQARRQYTLDFKSRKKIQEADMFEEKETSFEDQLLTDEYIKNFKLGKGKDGKGTNVLKRPLTPDEQDILDIMLIGSADRFKLDEINKYESENWGNLSKHEKNIIAQERYKAAGTSLNRAGFNSESVNDKIILDLMNRYNEKLITTYEPPKKLAEATKENNKAADEPLKMKVSDSEGKEAEVEIDTNHYSGFEKLNRGEIKDAELRDLVDMLADNINHYKSRFGDNSKDIAENINLLTRGLVGKDLAAMNKEDYRVMNRYFNDLRSGTWYMRNIVPKLKQKGIIPKRAHMQFPLTSNKERMMEDIVLSYEQGYFQNYDGTGKIGKMAKPTHYLERMQFFTGTSVDLATRYDDLQKQELRDELLKETGYESIPEGERLYEIAVALREQPMINEIASKKRGDAYDSVLNYRIKQYQDSITDSLTKNKWDDLKDRKFKVSLGAKDKNMTGQQIVDNINKVITKRNEKIHTEWISKNKKNLAKYQIGHHDEGGLIPKYDIVKFTKHISNLYKKGEPVDMNEFGLDGLREISRSMMLQSPDTNSKLAKAILKQDVSQTGQMDFSVYFPHAHMDNKAALQSLKRGLDFIEKSELTPTEKAAEKKKMLIRTKTLTGDWLPHDMIEYQAFDGALREIAKGKDGDWMKWFNSNPRTGNMMSRNNHIGGWAKDPGVYEIYQNNLIKTYYRQLAQIMNRATIEEFEINNLGFKGKEHVEAWKNFYRLYAQDAMGFPNNIPRHFLNKDSGMNIAGTPYAWWADSNVKRIVNNVRKKLGIKEDLRLPEELRGVDVSHIRHWSNIEARYQMATLLAHPKSAIANIYGGTLHTVQSVGWRNWRNSRNVEYLRTNLPGEAKNWLDKGDMTKWAVKHGVVPDFILYEAGLNPQFRTGRWKAFVDDAMSLFNKDPHVKDHTLISLAKKHKITENAFHKAAWFMREPERALRRDAFISHYLQARENIGNAEMPLDHPFLIEQAKKGVKATQFLYSAPYRPPFSRSALGKVMTRFQLWAWNAVRFRKDVIAEAEKHGWRPGTPEFERFKRTMTTDMFVLGMSNIFAYSIFENALPAPWNWFQDTADWLFGDEKARDRAFFGAYPTQIAPLQVITPPIARIGPATFSAMVNNDYSRLSEYYIWTMFPFGRLARDVKNSIENPIRTIENFTGIPYGQFHREMKSIQKEDDEPTE